MVLFEHMLQVSRPQIVPDHPGEQGKDWYVPPGYFLDGPGFVHPMVRMRGHSMDHQ